MALASRAWPEIRDAGTGIHFVLNFFGVLTHACALLALCPRHGRRWRHGCLWAPVDGCRLFLLCALCSPSLAGMPRMCRHGLVGPQIPGGFPHLGPGPAPCVHHTLYATSFVMIHIGFLINFFNGVAFVGTSEK